MESRIERIWSDSAPTGSGPTRLESRGKGGGSNATIRTVSCSKCRASQPIEGSQNGHRIAEWCLNCGAPLAEGPETAAASPPATVLWIDDDRLLLAFGKDALEQRGYRIFTAPDGFSGIGTANAERPDLIILDLIMPNMDGFQVCRQLRANPGLKDTPILLLTALEESQVHVWGGEVGATFTMTKPSDPESIIGIVERLLTRKPAPSER